jgi:hypothetical protein
MTNQLSNTGKGVKIQKKGSNTGKGVQIQEKEFEYRKNVCCYGLYFLHELLHVLRIPECFKIIRVLGLELRCFLIVGLLAKCTL